MMRAYQICAFIKRLPRNARNLSALHGCEPLGQVDHLGVLQECYEVDVTVNNSIQSFERLF
jgi:hypothetical protein